MIIDFILQHVIFLKEMQSLGAKHDLGHVAILRHFTSLNQALTKFGKKKHVFCLTVNFK